MNLVSYLFQWDLFIYRISLQAYMNIRILLLFF